MIFQNNCYITVEEEWRDAGHMANILRGTGWMDNKVVIVNCFPDYSSITTQIINHKLSHINRNDLFEQITLELPYKGMSQIWNRETSEYEMFDRYIVKWIVQNINKDMKYLFITSKIVDGRPFNKLKNLLRDKAKDYKIVSLYLQENADFIPDEYISIIPKEKRIVFSWENGDNNNF